MKQKSVSMLLLALSIGLLSVVSVASADTITYTGKAYVSKCNVCLEATVLTDLGDPNSGVSVLFRIKPKVVGGSWSSVGTMTTGDDGVAALCIGEKAPGEYSVRAKVVGAVPRTRVTTDLFVYAARATGGGQIVTELVSGLKRKDRFKISFGIGAYDLGTVAGLKLTSCEVTFHNVSNVGVDAIDKWKFVGTVDDGLTGLTILGGGTGAVLTVSGELLNKRDVYQGDASITIYLQDLGEPASDDNIRFVLSGHKDYDSSEIGSGDFPNDRRSRTYTTAGNLQVEGPGCPE